jgi:hypothetical protein
MCWSTVLVTATLVWSMHLYASFLPQTFRISLPVRPFFESPKNVCWGTNIPFTDYQAMLSVAQNVNRMVSEYWTRTDMKDAVVSYSPRICVMWLRQTTKTIVRDKWSRFETEIFVIRKINYITETRSLYLVWCYQRTIKCDKDECLSNSPVKLKKTLCTVCCSHMSREYYNGY